MGRIGRVREDRHPADLGDDLLEQLQRFADDFQADAVGQPCDVPARAREARDEPEPDRIANADHDDGDRPVAFLAATAAGVAHRHDDVHLEPDQLGREVGQPLEPALRKSILDDDVLALDLAELPQALPERVEYGAAAGRMSRDQNADPRNLLPRCCASTASGAARRPAAGHDEGSAVHHWMIPEHGRVNPRASASVSRVTAPIAAERDAAVVGVRHDSLMPKSDPCSLRRSHPPLLGARLAESFGHRLPACRWFSPVDPRRAAVHGPSV